MKVEDFYHEKAINNRVVVLKYINLAVQKDKQAELAMPYGVPGLKHKGKNLIAFAAHKNHFGVYPFSPSIVKEIVKKYPDLDYAEGTLRFRYDNLPKRELIEQIILLRKNEIS